MKPFPWRQGMTATLDGRRWTVHLDVTRFGGETLGTLRVPPASHEALILVRRGESRWFTAQDQAAAQPDLTDAATVGALLGAVREAWRDAAAHCVPTTAINPDDTPKQWLIFNSVGRVPTGVGPTEGAALLAAWEAAP